MYDELEYRATIKSKPFLFKETKMVASLVNQGYNDVEIKNKVKNDNIFKVNTETRKSEIASIVLKRLKVLDEYLIEKIAKGDIKTGKQIVIYAIMKTDRLFFEFMYEVFREKIIINNPYLQDKDFNLFFARKKEQSQRVASWQDYTFYKLKQVYIRILFEAGFIKNHKNEIEIIKPIIEADVEQYLKKIGDSKYLNALLGEI